MNDHDVLDETLVERLRAWPTPQATPTTTTTLMTRLTPELRRQRSAWLRARAVQGWALLRAQLYVVQGDVWIGSAVVLALGVLVTLATHTSITRVTALPFVLIAPLLTACAVSLLYAGGDSAMTELESATPTPARLVLIARLTLLFGINLLLGVMGSAALSVFGIGLSLWALVTVWLAPMAFLSALAFATAVVFQQPTVSLLVSLLVWGGQVLRESLAHLESQWLHLIPDLMHMEARPVLWLLTLVLVTLATWWAGRETYWLNSMRTAS